MPSTATPAQAHFPDEPPLGFSKSGVAESRTQPLASVGGDEDMRSGAICTNHSAAESGGRHVLAHARDNNEPLNSNFLENMHVAIE